VGCWLGVRPLRQTDAEAVDRSAPSSACGAIEDNAFELVAADRGPRGDRLRGGTAARCGCRASHGEVVTGGAPAAFDFRATFELEGNELTVRAMLAEEPADDKARYFVGS